MKLTPAYVGATTILLLCSVIWVAFPRPAETKPVSSARATTPERTSGASAGSREGIVISLHGGGWVGDRELPLIRRKMRPFVKPVLAAGWSVIHLAYSTGAAPALADIHRTYRRIKRRFGASKPVCLLGNSAGGHLALTYAGITAKRPDLRAADCVIASAAPTNIPAFRREIASRPPERRGNLERFLEIGFRDRGQMLRLSPVRYAPIFKSKTLLFTVQGDRVVPSSQVLTFAEKLERHRPGLFAKEFVLEQGKLPFVHRNTSAADWQTYREEVRSILRSVS